MVLLSICLIFCQFQPGFAYKSAAYKKSEYNTEIMGRPTCYFVLLIFTKFIPAKCSRK